MFAFVIFFTLSFVCLLLALHPFVTYPASLILLGQRIKRPITPVPHEKPSYAICVCAYNEEAVIEAKARNLLELKQAIPGLEVFIYVDCASDRTAEILSAYKADFDIHVATERHGKSYGMNLLLEKVKSSIVIFSDANVMLDVQSIPNLENYFADPQVGCVCGNLIYVNDVDTKTAVNGSLYWKLEEKIKQLESDTGSIMGADGSIFAIRRHLHVPPPADMIDDMFVSFNILCKGYRIVRAADVIAYEKSVTVAQEEFRRKVRIACQAFNVHRALWPQLRALPALDLYKYVSHKLLRWFTALWLVLAGVFFALSLLVVGQVALCLALAALGAGLLWLGAKKEVPLLSQITDILYAFLGAGLGVWKSLQGERFQTWAPANSIRGKGKVS